MVPLGQLRHSPGPATQPLLARPPPKEALPPDGEGALRAGAGLSNGADQAPAAAATGAHSPVAGSWSAATASGGRAPAELLDPQTQ